MKLDSREPDSAWPPGSDELSRRIRAFDWASTPLGSVETWPSRLKAAVEKMLSLDSPAQQSEERQTFLSKLSDALRPLSDAREIRAVACRLLGEHLAAARVYYVENEPQKGYGVVADDYSVPGLPSLAGRYPLEAFKTTYDRIGRGATWVMNDVTSDSELRAGEREYYAAQGVIAWVDVPLLKSGGLEAVLCVVENAPRSWTESEIKGIEEAAERLWADTRRARAEAALRESEEQYRTLFESLDDGFCTIEVIFDAQERPSDCIFRQTNSTFERQAGRTDLVGQSVRERFPGQEPSWLDLYARVARTGESVRHESGSELLGGWYDVYAYRIGKPDKHLVGILFRDITERKRADAVLRESEERQAFLLQLIDALRPLSDARQIKATAARVLARHLGVQRAYYAEVQADGDEALIENDFSDGVPSMAGRLSLRAFRRLSKEGPIDRPVILPDVRAELRRSQAGMDPWTQADIGALVAVPIVKDGRLSALLVAAHGEAREWTPADLTLLSAAAELAWAAAVRGRAETALRESEARFQQFAAASSGALWIRDAGTLGMEYVSPAIAKIYGVLPDAFLGDMRRWAATILAEDRDGALLHLEQARHGDAVVHEFRIQRPSDQSFRWIRNTDFPLFDREGRVQRIGGIAEDVTEAKLLVEHQGVLLAELQHRVRNIMAIIRSIVARTGEHAESVKEYAGLVAGRLLALSRVQALLTRAANVGVGIRILVHDEVSVQAHHEGQYDLDGPDIELSPKAAEVLTLAVHELVTNALKYGALSVPSGRVTVRWAPFEKNGRTWLGFDWTEEGAPAPPQPAPDAPRRRGFGSELIERRVPYELGGRGEIVIAPGGARCHLEFPLREGASILETRAPQRATVFGGALDMTGETDLSGRRILVVEDDYYLATDIARVLKGAGAEILGPCATEEAARTELEAQRPDAAVVDINLGTGPVFTLARLLLERGIPLLFTTGYDQEVIPEDLSGIERLAKPVQLRLIARAVSKLLTPAP